VEGVIYNWLSYYIIVASFNVHRFNSIINLIVFQAIIRARVLIAVGTVFYCKPKLANPIQLKVTKFSFNL
jgi:hypothetical protein